MLRLTWISLSFVLFFSLKKLEFDNYEVDQVVGRKKIRSLATSCFNDKLVFLTAARCFVLVNMVCWFVWEGVKFLINWSISLHFFLLSRDLLVFCVFTQFVSKKVFAGKFGLLCNSLHWNIAGSFFFVNCILRAQKWPGFLANVFLQPHLVQFSTICFEVKLDTNWV